MSRAASTRNTWDLVELRFLSHTSSRSLNGCLCFSTWQCPQQSIVDCHQRADSVSSLSLYRRQSRTDCPLSATWWFAVVIAVAGAIFEPTAGLCADCKCQAAIVLRDNLVLIAGTTRYHDREPVSRAVCDRHCTRRELQSNAKRVQVLPSM
jgi:hypothetical protein